MEGLAEGSRLRERALVGTAMLRDKALIGPRLRARTFAAQKMEAWIAFSVINGITELGMPISQRTR
jgi:hypothetical protein